VDNRHTEDQRLDLMHTEGAARNDGWRPFLQYLMKKIRWQLIIILLTGLIVGVLLLGQQTPIGPTEVAPTAGGVYSEGLIGSFVRFNPDLDYYNAADHSVDRLLFSGLIKFDARGVAIPDIAQAWGISQDGTLYNFALRENAVWHDGQRLTSADVLFTIDFLRSPYSSLPEDVRQLWNQVEVTAFDETTIQFKLNESFAPFLDYLTFGILPKHILGILTPDQIVNANFGLNPVGSGPYRLDHLIVENDQVKGAVLSVFGGYYGQAPFIQQIVFRYYPDARMAFEAYMAGEIQGISEVTPDILADVLDLTQLNTYSGRKPEMTMVLFNTKNTATPFFDDKHVRRGLMFGLNRRWIVDRILGGQAIIADGPIFPGTWAYYDGIEHIDFDAVQAGELLKEAGYVIPAEGGTIRAKENQQLAFELVHPDDAQHQAIAEQIQKDWQAIGVKVDLLAVPYQQLVSDYLETRNYQAALVDLDLSHSPDPDPYPFWHESQATGGQNYSQWSLRSASEYLEKARTNVDPDTRTKLYKNFQVLFTREMPSLPLYYPVYTYAVDSSIRGVQMGPLFDTADRFATILDWFVVTRAGSQAEGSTVEVTPTTAQ
jgi:peptide/nickel transport system substrate-binding protein